MKKKFTFSAALILISVMSFAQCPDYFKRNNGNGTCGSEAEIRMYFAACPTTAPIIDSIRANGVIANVTVSAPDGSNCASKGYISYCISGDLPPAGTLTVFFDFGEFTGKDSCIVPEGGPSGGPTPVVLSSFNAERGGKNAVNITWKTEQELNSSRYEIQRSFNNIDFETVGVVYSKNSNTSIAQYYSFTDNSNNLNSTSFYRLKMIDLDNSFTYSYVKAVTGSSLENEIIVSPNPAQSGQMIMLRNLSEPSSIRIFDYSGKLIQSISSTGNSVQINNLQNGFYYVNITGKQTGVSSVKKLTVLK
ncbi:MAG: T9SS type A sorting domain-containing protein [Bacteroidota bacterium]|nr:T9SS type A sorting domain-containing protein [Bacteroidota bacterium]